jgi:hypothetical protein
MLALSVVALVNESVVATTAAIAISLTSGVIGLWSVVGQLNRYRRAMRPEHRSLVVRFMVFLVGSWSLYPILFVLGPGIGNFMDISTLTGLLAILDLLSKNCFVLWVWSASFWLRRSERQSAELLNLFGVEPSAFHAEARDLDVERQILQDRGIEVDDDSTMAEIPLATARPAGAAQAPAVFGARVAAAPASDQSLSRAPSSIIASSSRWLQSAIVQELHVTEDSV